MDRDDLCCCCVPQISRAQAQLPGGEPARPRGVPWRPAGVRQCHGLPALLILSAQCRSDTAGIAPLSPAKGDWNTCACMWHGRDVCNENLRWCRIPPLWGILLPHTKLTSLPVLKFLLFFFFALHFTVECKMQVDEKVGQTSHCSSTG